VSENRVLRRIFGLKREEVAGHVARMEEMRNVYIILVGRPGRRRKDNVRLDLRELGWEGVDWIHLVQDRDQWWAVAETAMNLGVP
jgi:hypothetical protein